MFGVLGYGVMVFEGLLGLRKKFPIWRVGRAQTWMRAHLWLGLLSLPLILFHGGFMFRGPLTFVMMMLFFIVIISGVLGAALQHYVPKALSATVPLETIYEEIPHVREQLRDEADELVSALCGPLEGIGGAARETVTGAVLVEVEHQDKQRFREAYLRTIRPFLEQPEAPHGELAPVFRSMRTVFPEEFCATVNDLENICDEERQLTRQQRMYRWLHTWLLVHVPLSIALLVLGGVHAVMALRY
jgi:hypothetical protein